MWRLFTCRLCHVFVLATVAPATDVVPSQQPIGPPKPIGSKPVSSQPQQDFQGKMAFTWCVVLRLAMIRFALPGDGCVQLTTRVLFNLCWRCDINYTAWLSLLHNFFQIICFRVGKNWQFNQFWMLFLTLAINQQYISLIFALRGPIVWKSACKCLPLYDGLWYIDLALENVSLTWYCRNVVGSWQSALKLVLSMSFLPFFMVNSFVKNEILKAYFFQTYRLIEHDYIFHCIFCVFVWILFVRSIIMS